MELRPSYADLVDWDLSKASVRDRQLSGLNQIGGELASALEVTNGR